MGFWRRQYLQLYRATNPSHRYLGRDLFGEPYRHQYQRIDIAPQIRSVLCIAPPPAAPVASFTGTPLPGTAPLDVMFTDSSTGDSITNRRWDFGDGNTSNFVAATNPSHWYSSAGTYSVNLTVTNAGRIQFTLPDKLCNSKSDCPSCLIPYRRHQRPAVVSGCHGKWILGYRCRSGIHVRSSWLDVSIG